MSKKAKKGKKSVSNTAKSLDLNNDLYSKVKITTGPFLVPLEVDSEIQVGRENDKLIVIVENPTSIKGLTVSLKLSICLQPESEENITNDKLVFQDIPEIKVDLGKYVINPHTCTRIERNIPGEIGVETDERNAIYRITAKGHFNISKQSYLPIGGLLELSVITGSVFNPEEPGLEQADAATFFSYKDFLLVEST